MSRNKSENVDDWKKERSKKNKKTTRSDVCAAADPKISCEAFSRDSGISII